MATYNELVVKVNAETNGFESSIASALLAVKNLSAKTLQAIDVNTSAGKQMIAQLASEAESLEKNLSSSLSSLGRKDFVLGSQSKYDRGTSEAMLKSKQNILKEDKKYATEKEKIEKQLTKASEKAEKAKQAAIKNTQKAVQNVSKSMSTALSSAGSALQSFGSKVSTLGNTVSSLGTQLTSTVTTALTAISAAAISVGTTFEANMNRVKAITGAVGEEYQMLEDEAKRLGVTTPKTAQEIAEGMSTLALSGMDTQEVYENISGVVNLSILTMDDMATSAQNAADIMSQFGNQGLNLDQIMDILSKTATTSNQSVQQLIDAMKFAGPVASDLGVSVEETAGMLGVLANSGVRAGIAGRAVRMMFLSLSAPSSGAAAAIEELGLETYDSEGNFKSMSDILLEMNELMSDYSQETRQATLRTIFGTRALGPLSILLNSVSTETDQATDSFVTYAQMLEDVNDTSLTTESITEELVETINSGFVQAKNEFKSALQGLLIELQELLVVGLEPMLERLTEIIRAFATLEQGTSKILAFFFTLKERIAESNFELEELTVTFMNFEIRVGQIASDLIEHLSNIINKWGEFLGIGAILQIDDDMTQGDLIDKILAIAALAPMIMILGKGISMLGSGISVIGGLLVGVSKFIGPIGNLISTLVGAVGPGGALAGLFGGGAGVSGAAALGPIAAILVAIIALVKGLIEHFGEFKDKLIPVLGEFFDALKPIFSVLSNIIDILGDVLGPLFYSLLIPALRLVTMYLKQLEPLISLLNFGLNVAGVILRRITSGITALMDSLDSLFEKIEDSFIFDWFESIAGWINSLFDFDTTSNAGSLFTTNDDTGSIIDLDDYITEASTQATIPTVSTSTNSTNIVNNYAITTESMSKIELERFAYDTQVRATIDSVYGG